MRPSFACSGPRGRAPRDADPRVVRARWLLGLGLAALLLVLVFGPHPWAATAARQRLARGQGLRPGDSVHLYAGWSAAASALVLGGLLATLRRWLGPAEVTPTPVAARVGGLSARSFGAAVAGAVLVAAALAAPRLAFGLWDDEIYAVRQHVAGEYRPDRAGRLHFDAVPLRDTLWNDVQANNHVPYSIAARLSLDAWRALASPPTRLVSEPAVRLPAYLAGLAALVAVACFARRLGYAWAGIVAAWLLAVHPWVVRYTSEARGYALILLLLPVTWLLLLRALEYGTWRRWLGYGAGQMLLLWVHAGMVYQLVVTNGAALAAIGFLQRGRPPDARRAQRSRLLVANALGAALYLVWMGPNLPQILHYLQDWRGRAGPAALPDVASYLFAGVEWRTRDARYLTLHRLGAAHPLLVWSAAAVCGVAALAGIVHLVRRGGVPARLAPALVLPAPTLYAATWVRDDRLYVWYLVFALPGLALGIGVAAEALLERAGPRRLARLAAAAVVAGGLGLYVAAVRVPLRELRRQPLQAMRDSVLRARGTLDPFAPGQERILTASWHHPPSYYDPRVRVVKRPAELRALMRESDARGLALFVSNGRPAAAHTRYPELARIVGCEALFERIETTAAFESRGERELYRYRGGAGRTGCGPGAPHGGVGTEGGPRVRRGRRGAAGP